MTVYYRMDANDGAWTSTFNLVFQWKGSVAQSCLSVVLFNLFVTFSLLQVDTYAHDYFPKVHNTAFTILGTLLSFLLVSRVNQGLARYTSGRTNLADIAFESREMAVKILGSGDLSVTIIAGGHEEYPPWKLRAVRMVKAVMKMCCYELHFVEINKDGVHKDVRDFLKFCEFESESDRRLISRDEMRVLSKHTQPTLKMLKMLRFELISEGCHDAVVNVQNLAKKWHAMDVAANTPNPFPLVQMQRLFLCCYVLSMPFVLVDDLKHWSYLFVPLLTYGFWGLDVVAVCLSDPFGSDTNDLDIQQVVDDCFATIADDFALEKPESFKLTKSMKAELAPLYQSGESVTIL